MIKWICTLFIAIIAISQANGNEMKNFSDLQNIAEQIVRERAYDPQQLAVILSTSFDMLDDDLPNHFRYKAKIEGGELFSACDLRAPKTNQATSAILICDVIGEAIDGKLVTEAYGESVQFKPAQPSAPPTAHHYLSVQFDNAELSFGVDQKSDKIKSMVINFNL